MVDLRLLKLGGFGVVLGVDWMKGVSPISFDFNKMEVTFEKDGNTKTLSGNHESGMCKMISGKRLQRMFKSKFSQVAQLFSICASELTQEKWEQEGELAMTINSSSHEHWKVQEINSLNMLLIEFRDLFSEPSALPPKRPHDHTINLKPNAKLVNQGLIDTHLDRRLKSKSSLRICYKSPLYNQATVHLLLPCYLSKRKMVHGGFVWIIANSMP